MIELIRDEHECADRLNRRLVNQYRTVRAMRATARRMKVPVVVQQDLGLR